MRIINDDYGADDYNSHGSDHDNLMLMIVIVMVLIMTMIVVVMILTVMLLIMMIMVVVIIMSASAGWGWPFLFLGKASMKKNVFFRALPESPNPPPDPNSGNLVLFFRTSKFKI